ncbi:hypothetical protein ACIBCN_19295 [Nocardia sp. NPDC051052]|uniref:hypothetical protein n=1 Tax=Nocardia sp. NPDC051052 TaxID=3364322 RepID=UPI0037A05B09
MATRTSRPNSKPSAATPPAADTAEYVQQDVPKDEQRSSRTGRGPIPKKWLITVKSLVKEQWRIGAKRPANRYSNLEATVTAKGVTGAEEARDKGAKKLSKVVEQFDNLRAELIVLKAELLQIPTLPVAGPNGEVLTATQAEARMAAVQAVVTKETDEGSLKHRRVSRWLVRLAPFVVVLDGPVMLWFCSQIFNVNWSALSQSIIPLITSGVFAVLATVAIALALHKFGRDLKAYKDNRGHISLPSGQAKVVPLTFIGLSVSVTLGSGVVMAYRIISESLSAGSDLLGGSILGVFFAIIVIALNVVIFAVNYRDGSTQTDELDHHAKQLLPVRLTERQFEEKAEKLTTRLKRLQSAGFRIYDATVTKMSEPLAAANQLILQARSYHQGCGHEAELVPSGSEPVYGALLPMMSVDTSVLDNLLKQLNPVEDGQPEQVQAVAA